MTTPKVYLITGCSSGLGHALALAALRAGHHVLATARDPSTTPADKLRAVTSLGGRWAALDVTSPTLEADLAAAVLPLLPGPGGRLDVLVNNAGVADVGAVEALALARARAVLETNLWGLVRLSRAVVPIMRTQGRGTIVNVSSSSALAPVPLLSVYAASKAAVDGFTAALAGEVAPLGVRVLLVTPGGMRTPFVANNERDDERERLPDGYRGAPYEMVLDHLLEPKNFSVDPDRAAATIVAAVDGTGALEGKGKGFLRLPLGEEVLGSMEGRIAELTGAVDGFADIAKSVDLNE